MIETKNQSDSHTDKVGQNEKEKAATIGDNEKEAVNTTIATPIDNVGESPLSQSFLIKGTSR